MIMASNLHLVQIATLLDDSRGKIENFSIMRVDGTVLFHFFKEIDNINNDNTGIMLNFISLI